MQAAGAQTAHQKLLPWDAGVKSGQLLTAASEGPYEYEQPTHAPTQKQQVSTTHGMALMYARAVAAKERLSLR